MVVIISDFNNQFYSVEFPSFKYKRKNIVKISKTNKINNLIQYFKSLPDCSNILVETHLLNYIKKI